MRKGLCLLLAPLLLCSGCAPFRPQVPLEAVETVETLGLDQGDRVTVSVTTGSDAESERISAAGETIPLALEAAKRASLHGGLFCAHTQYLLLGERFAQAGVLPLLDYAARSAELRLLTPVYVLRGADAETVITDDPDVTAQLTALARSDVPQYNALDTADRLARTGTALLGAVRYDPEAQTLSPDGYAVLQNGKQIGRLDAPAWLLGSETGKLSTAQASAALKRCSVRLEADWAEDAPTALTLVIRADAEIEQLEAGVRITDAEVEARLERDLAEAIAAQAAAAVGRTQALRADALGLGDLLAVAHPIRWRRLYPNWAALFPALPVTVRAIVNITGTQDLSDPLPEDGAP